MDTYVVSPLASTAAPVYNRGELTEATANNQRVNDSKQSQDSFPTCPLYI